jgi:hypothetical protein
MEHITAHKIGDEIRSSSGGTIKFTETGLLHIAGRTYGGEGSDARPPVNPPAVNEDGEPIKRGRGRPLGSKNRTTKW